MKQPHIYTLPERFIKDPAVPFRWKLYTILNGFWIAGKPVFASNAWFAEKLGCSDRTVREGLLELEGMYLIARHGSSQKRRIIPGGHGELPESERVGTLGATQGGTTGAVGVAERVPHIADSIADRDTRVSTRPVVLEEITITSDLDGELGTSKSPRISGDKLKAYNELIAWSENERGFKFPKSTLTKQYRAFKLATENGFTRDDLMTKWEDLAADKFWQKTGFDWMNVVQELFKKPV